MNNSYVAILGRQPALGLAELERRFGAAAVTPLNDMSALLLSDAPVNIAMLGGSVKIARVVSRTAGNGWLGVSKQAVKYFEQELARSKGKITLGVSAYGFDVDARDVQKTGLIIKSRLKNRDGSVRLVPNDVPALSSAQTYHNKFGTSPLKRELVLVSGRDGHGYIAEVTGVQDIDAYTLRDRGRPKRDTLNGMLPPKLAQIMVNLGVDRDLVWDYGHESEYEILDPFCGTGVVLMEAALMGYSVHGSDINPKMVEYSFENLRWLYTKMPVLQQGNRLKSGVITIEANATSAKFPFANTIVSETYLGEPMAQEPKSEKLARAMEECDHVIRAFLANAVLQPAGGNISIAVPAWRIDGEIKHLPVVDDLEELGYNWIDFEHVKRSDLIYYREDQIVARELLVLKRS